MSDPNDLPAFWDTCWQHLTRGVADAKSPARYPTFVTVGKDNTPQARTVALRSAVKSSATVEVHTDIETPKVSELRHNPACAFHIWIPRAELQIRLNATIEVLTGPTIDAAWHRIPSASRVSYGTMPYPGTPISHVYEYDKPAERARFAVLRGTIDTVDLVELGTFHRRAAFNRSDGWKGTWLAP